MPKKPKSAKRQRPKAPNAECGDPNCQACNAESLANAMAVASESVETANGLVMVVSKLCEIMAPIRDVAPALHCNVGMKLFRIGLHNEPTQKRHLIELSLQEIVRAGKAAGIVVDFKIVSREGK